MIDVTTTKRPKSVLKLDLLKCFGADFQLNIRDPLFFAGENGNAIIYPVGHHIGIRDIFVREELRRNDIMFIYNDDDVIKVTSMNTTKDYSLLLVCEKKKTNSLISIYNLSKLNFRSIQIFKPKRKVISSIYSEFIYACFSLDGNYIASIGKVFDSNELHGIIWDVQIFQSYKEDNYKPKCVFSLPNGVTKITIENKIICTSGENHLSFWYIYENSVKEFKGGIKNLDLNICNFVDHEWLNIKNPTLAAITEQRELFIFEGYNDNNSNLANLARKDEDNKDDDNNYSVHVEKFIIKQHLQNIFNSELIIPNYIKCFNKGIIIGSTKGHLLFVEKLVSGDSITFTPIRYTKRDKQAGVTGIAVTREQEYIAVAYDSNEIAYFNIKNIFDNLKTINFELKMSLVCDGFHQGAITCMDVALQRPIIVTTSNIDKTVRVWNFLTGHCEYCKIILTEKEKNQEKEMDILSVAIHPNGYYLAISDREMIRFFHLCYKELRFYNNDSTVNETPKNDCHLLKFSYGGHLLAAVSGKLLYLIRSYTRETLKAFETPHTSNIEKIFFHEQDYFIYTVGSDGLIVEYNLFNFHIEKLSNKIITYTNGAFNYLNKNQTIINSVGIEGGDRNIIGEILCTDVENTYKNIEAENFNLNNTNRTNELYLTTVEKTLTSICNIKSKRFDIGSYATGSSDGYISLYPSLLMLDTKGKNNPSYIAKPWKSVKSHRNRITNIIYNRDTNLLFSSGEDGNLFIYCIHELQDGENLSYDDNTSSKINQITSILDEGLGENVLYPLSNIFVQEEEILNQNNLINEYKNQEEKLKQEHANKLREREIELNKKRETESKELNERLSEEKLSKEGIIEHYKEQIKQIENEHRQTLIEKEKQYTERIDQMSNTIHDLNSKIFSLKAEHEIDLKKKDEGYEKKFREIDAELRNKFEEIKNNNDKLSNELTLRQKLEEYKFIHLDQEHEQEINYKNEKFETEIAKMEKERLVNQGEISTLNNDKKKLLNELNICENEIKKKNEEIKRYQETIQNLREANEMKENEKEELKKKLKSSESKLQEKSILANFSSSLKNELYKKNTEILSIFNKQQVENGELKETSKNIERELDENIRLLQNREKEIKKNQLLLEEYKEKYERERHNTKLIEKDFDNLLQKIYETFQSNDKNVIIKGIKGIYNLYLTGDVVKKIDSSKLNVNIRDELTKQIDFLQKEILSMTEMKNRREKNQNSEIFKKTRENSKLIDELNKLKKDFKELEKNYKILKSDHSALTKKYDQYQRENNNISSLNSINNAQNLPNIANNNMNYEHSGRTVSSNKDNFANTVYQIKDNTGFYNPLNNQRGFNQTFREKKSWKDGKLYKGTSLSQFRDKRNETYKMTEIKRILDEKNEIIRKQKVEIEMLQNNLVAKDKTISNFNKTGTNSNKMMNSSTKMGFTTYGTGFANFKQQI